MIAQADAIRIPLGDKSVHCAVTSPPYWGLRKYAGDQGRIWGGDPECEHEWTERRYYTMRGASSETSEAFSEAGKGNSERLKKARWRNDSICENCGAWYGSLGLEPTPKQHTENIVGICREVRRVLRDDGVFWLNYGDCYGHGTEARRPQGNTRGISDKTSDAQNINRHGGTAGNLMMMPHRVALALQADGWIVRQDLVWFKRNPMPESVNGRRWQRERTRKGDDPRGNESNQQARTLGQPPQRDHDGSDKFAQPEYEYGDDLELRKGSWRHTRAHEYVFMLVKGMQYWSNQEAVREGTSNNTHSRGIKRDPPIDHAGQGHDAWVSYMDRDAEIASAGRNPRSVLDVPTAPYKGAHYATFPPNLIAPLIRATCPRWACPVCGQGWAAVVERSGGTLGKGWHDHSRDDEVGRKGGYETNVAANAYASLKNEVLGYRPTCEHEHTQEEAVPGIVFDPFVGSGTTVAVAQQLLRRGIGIDISMEYLDQQAKIRAGLGTPSNALDDLPLFGNIMAIKAE